MSQLPKICTVPATQVQPLVFQARVKSTAAHETQPLAFKALVKPSTRPSSLCLYHDAALQQRLALVEEAGGSYFVLQQTAGKQVKRHVWPSVHKMSVAGEMWQPHTVVPNIFVIEAK